MDTDTDDWLVEQIQVLPTFLHLLTNILQLCTFCPQTLSFAKKNGSPSLYFEYQVVYSRPIQY